MFRQLAYTRIGQGLTGLPRTFAILKDLFAGYIPSPSLEPALQDILDVGFAHFVNDDLGAAHNFKSMFAFLYNHYFPRLV